MEIFDFSTTAISGLVSVFSAIMGMMYPLLLQAIQQVDDRYRSTRMSKMLLKEKAFVRFQFLLVISVLLALASVFLCGCLVIIIGLLLDGFCCIQL